jgi:hypothetical protein
VPALPNGGQTGLSATAYRIPSRYFAQLVDYLQQTGVPRAELLRAARIRTLDDPRGQLTVRQTEAFIEVAERLSGRQAGQTDVA